MARVGQGIDPLELLVDGAGQGEGIERGALAAQLRGHLGAEVGAGEHAIQGGAGHVIAAAAAGALNRRIRFPFRGEEGSVSFYLEKARGRRRKAEAVAGRGRRGRPRKAAS